MAWAHIATIICGLLYSFGWPMAANRHNCHLRQVSNTRIWIALWWSQKAHNQVRDDPRVVGQLLLGKTLSLNDPAQAPASEKPGPSQQALQRRMVPAAYLLQMESLFHKGKSNPIRVWDSASAAKPA